jgi:hypothetical protein
MPGIELGFTAATVVIILLVVAATAVAILFYRYTLPPVPRATRIILIALRASALSFLLILLFEPILRLIFSSTVPPVLAMLVDDSKSMRIVDKSGDRAEALRSLLRSDGFRTVSGKIGLRDYTFGVRLRERGTLSSDSLQMNDDATDISSALHSLADDKDRGNIHAVLLITDGSYNVGQNPLYEALQLGLPLYTIGIGDSSEQKDILITKVLANDRVYNESKTVVDVTVKSSGFKDEKIEVTVNDGTKELDRKVLELGEGTREYPVQLAYVPEGEGTKKLTVKISTLPGELTTNNNLKSFYVKVLKNKLRVLLIAGAPSPDLSIIKQTLAEDRNIAAQSFTQRQQGGFYEGALSGSRVDSSDCIVLIGFPTAGTSAATLDLLANAFTQRRTPFLFINGKTVNDTKLRAFSAELPFVILSSSSQEQYVFFQPSETQKRHPILKVNETDATDVWDRLPPIFRTTSVYKAKPEATVLGFCKIQNVVLTEPLILTRNVNRQKSLAILGYGLWRWRLMAQGTSATEGLLSTFLANTIRWLTTRDDDRPVKATPTRDLFSHGEPAEFVGQAYDASAQPVENAQFRVTVEKDGSQSEVLLRPIGGGRYEGAIDGLQEGDYMFRAQAQTDGQQLGEDRGKFSVGGLDLEFQDTRMNASLLRQLAYRTGGHFFSPKELGELPTELAAQSSFTPREVTRTTDLELWNWQYTLAAIVLLLGVEWLIRKRRGML